MSGSDGIGRVYRVEFNPPVERHIAVEKSDKDKRGKDHDETKDDQPHDTVELHDEGQAPGQEPAKLPKPKARGLDISA